MTETAVGRPFVLQVAKDVAHEAADHDVEFGHAVIYVIEAVGLGRYKIGMTTDFYQRSPAYATECPVGCRIVLLANVPSIIVGAVEDGLHLHFDKKRVKGEWFLLSPDDIASLPSVIEAVAMEKREPALKAIRTHRKRRRRSAEVLLERELDAQLRRMHQAASVPTDELIIDRVTDAQQFGRSVDVADLVRSIDRRPQLIHEYVRDMICAGQIAIVSPRRNPTDGSIWLDAYRQADLIIPDETCDWELTNCGHEILVSEPLGEFVPQFFCRHR